MVTKLYNSRFQIPFTQKDLEDTICEMRIEKVMVRGLPSQSGNCYTWLSDHRTSHYSQNKRILELSILYLQKGEV